MKECRALSHPVDERHKKVVDDPPEPDHRGMGLDLPPEPGDPTPLLLLLLVADRVAPRLHPLFWCREETEETDRKGVIAVVPRLEIEFRFGQFGESLYPLVGVDIDRGGEEDPPSRIDDAVHLREEETVVAGVEFGEKVEGDNTVEGVIIELRVGNEVDTTIDGCMCEVGKGARSDVDGCDFGSGLL